MADSSINLPLDLCQPEPTKRKSRDVLKIALNIISSKDGMVQEINGRSTLTIRCHRGHEWTAKASIIARGSWCYRCFREKYEYTLEEMHSIARKNGGECLSIGDERLNSWSRIDWRCKAGHTWTTSATNARRETWCRECWNLSLKSSRLLKNGLELAKLEALKRGGECLSTEYKGVGSSLLWRCANSHKWTAKFSNVVTNQTWCPRCVNWRREEACRLTLERLYGCLFPSNRPEWLRSDKGIKLALDGYNSELGIAFEHQGEQHYKYIAHFHGSENNLYKRQEVDARKQWLCKKHNVILLEVPYSIPEDELPEWISNQLDKLGAPKQLHAPATVHPLTGVGVAALQKLRDVATARGGECLSTEYFGAARHHKFRCSEGHEWKTSAMQIFRGTWCGRCATARTAELNRIPNGLERMRQCAKDKGGECLSLKYHRSDDYYRWQCATGHQWDARATEIFKGSWCRICVHLSLMSTLNEYQIIAEKRGGVCLSATYKGGNIKLQWRCSNGHEWWARPQAIKRGGWCPDCHNSIRSISNPRKLNIHEMQRRAKAKGGECLSDTYVNTQTKLRWRCAVGHEWEAKPTASWCSICGYQKVRKDLKQLKTLHTDLTEVQKKYDITLINDYYNEKGIPEWCCKHGHIFRRRFFQIKTSGTACPDCYAQLPNSNKLRTIEDMQKLATERSGWCLSKSYSGSQVKLKWRCAQGHEWEARPDNVKNSGSWCPTCARATRNRASLVDGIVG